MALNPQLASVVRPPHTSLVAADVDKVVRSGWVMVWPPISFPSAAMLFRLARVSHDGLSIQLVVMKKVPCNPSDFSNCSAGS
ncbi:hypothetical protein AHiyo1_11890 [Arthrobacter sp. Hiyo1]|nr:hypothetical protein AHiyo1_11890 [Arthrobacter sp. Hiyo1]